VTATSRREGTPRLDEELRAWVARRVASSPWNRLPGEASAAAIFDPPLVGVAAGDDPLFETFKAAGAPELLTPEELWLQSGLASGPDHLSRLRVVSIVFPYTAAIREAGARCDRTPPDVYTLGRNRANPLIDSVLGGLEQLCRDWGFQAMAGVRSPVYEMLVGGEPYRALSTWSERHAAFAAGLGTFSLQRAFITAAGINVRLGSVVTDTPLAVTPRAGDEPFAHCLYLADGSCGDCMARCPAGAITTAGHDKQVCRAYVHELGREFQAGPLGALLVGHRQRANGAASIRYSTGCALCQFGVPCTSRNPRT
jgi:epoxyqueuosine reductase